MDQPPPSIDSADSAILDELKQALTAAGRCIDLARRERGRIDAASRALAAGTIDAEHQVLEQARARRKQLEALELLARAEPPPLKEAVPPPLEPQPAVMVLEELAVPT